jgi:RNA polymerase sigma factor (sigma-70 family)
MVDDQALKEWFCREVLPLERALAAFIRRNWRDAADVVDLRQDIYERVLQGARHGLPTQAGQFVYTVARNHLINRAKRARIVSFDVVADLDAISGNDVLDPERQLLAREELRRIQFGLEQLPPRCREVVLLRKIRGLSTRQTADELGIGIDTVEKQMTLGMRALANFMLGGSGKVQRFRAPGLLARRPAR